MKQLSEMTLRELIQLALMSDQMTVGKYLRELERRLPALEAAEKGMALLDATSGNLKAGSFEGPWSGLQQYIHAYRAAKETERDAG